MSPANPRVRYSDDPNWDILRETIDHHLFRDNFSQSQDRHVTPPIYCNHCGAVVYKPAWRIHLACCPALAMNRPQP